MKRKIFLTFSTKQLDAPDNLIAPLIEEIDKSDTLEVSYRWFEGVLPKDQMDYKIYEKGVKALLASDIIVADVSIPSTGVGQQIAFGMFHKISVLVIAKKEFEKNTHSLFLKGTKSTQVSFYYYRDRKDLVSNVITQILNRLDDSLEKLNFVATKSIKKILIEESRKRGISQSELLRQIITEWREVQSK